MIKWEHKKVFEPSEREFSELGEDGWEMCGFGRIAEHDYFFFKRPITSPFHGSRCVCGAVGPHPRTRMLGCYGT